MATSGVGVEVRRFLTSSNVPIDGNNLLQKLEDLGVVHLRDLKEVSQKHLEEAGLSATLQKRFMIAVISLVTDDDARPPQQLISLKYILCQKLFQEKVEEQSIHGLDANTHTVGDIINTIATRCSLHSNLSLELYSQEGYPLCVNEQSRHLTLKDWCVENNDLFFVFVRPTKQDKWELKESGPQSLSSMEGPDQLQIYSQLYQTFPINLDLTTTSVDTVRSKIAASTTLPFEYISLHRTVEDHAKLKTFENVANGSTIVMRINPFHTHEANFGILTYDPVQRQTDQGYSKFYSILKYLVFNGNRKLVAEVLHFTQCPPLAYAVQVLLSSKCILHLSHIVALFEGFYLLCSAMLRHFCLINPAEVMEFSDYVFGFLLKKSMDSTTPCLQVDIHDLTNYSSGHQRLLQPVELPQSTMIHEKLYVMTRIKRGLGIQHCYCDNLTEADISPSLFCKKMLTYNAFNSEKQMETWKLPLAASRSIPCIPMPCQKAEFAESVAALKIISPDEVEYDNKLTFIYKGRVVYFTQRDVCESDEVRRVYDPLEHKEILMNATTLETYAREFQDKVYHDLNSYSIAQAEPIPRLKVSKIIKQKRGLEEFTREPKEAIMVLMDCSESMLDPIFDETTEERLTRLDAAKEFFLAFAQRTESYLFEHVIGLITFSDTINVVSPFTEVVSYFKEAVQGELQTGRMTALYDAMIEAVRLLRCIKMKYPNCIRRILCLTDGGDSASKNAAHTVANLLQSESVIVDTILITGPSGNATQKSISHATGGFCFLPSSRAEAVRLFEMEVLLSTRDRLSSPNAERVKVTTKMTLQEYKKYPYDSNNPFDFKSKFTAEVDMMTSCSAKRIVQLSAFSGQSSEEKSYTHSQQHVKRVLQEIQSYLRDPHPCVEVFPNENNVCTWQMLLKGPESSPYAGGTYLLYAKFSDEYPTKPPEVRFVTPIYHCNINSSGRICHPVLGRNYLPKMSMKEVISNIYGLLMVPEPHNPLDSVLVSEFHSSHELYERRAREHTQLYATRRSYEEMKKDLSRNENALFERLTCPLSGKLFVDPVLTPFGNVYERRNIEQYMATHNNRDPIAHKPFHPHQLVLVPVVQELAANVRSSNI